jgi:hypothetical protein
MFDGYMIGMDDSMDDGYMIACMIACMMGYDRDG